MKRGLLIFSLVFGSWVSKAGAALTMIAEEVGSAVVFSWSGSINTSFFPFSDPLDSAMGGMNTAGVFLGYSLSRSLIRLSPGNLFTPTVQPFGSATEYVYASGFTGQPFGFDTAGRIGVPINYVSGSSLVGTLSFEDRSFADLGLTPSDVSYVWTLINGDTFALRVGMVPEPGRVFLLMAGMTVLSLKMRRRVAQIRDNEMAEDG